MDQMVRFQKYFFLATGFLLGSLIPLFGNAFNFILIVFMFVQIGMNRKEVLANLRQMSENIVGDDYFLGLFFLAHDDCVVERESCCGTKLRYIRNLDLEFYTCSRVCYNFQELANT